MILKTRLIISGIIAIPAMIVMIIINVPIFVAFLFSLAIFGILVYMTGPEYAERRAREREMRKHLELIREESRYSERGRQEAIRESIDIHRRNENMRRNPMGGLVGPSIFQQTSGHRKRR